MSLLGPPALKKEHVQTIFCSDVGNGRRRFDDRCPANLYYWDTV